MDKQNRIFVGGIPVRVDKKTIMEFFSQYGTILHCKIKKNSKTGRSLGYAYLTFENPESTALLVDTQVEFFGRICECKQVFKKEDLKEVLAQEKKKKLMAYQLDPTVTNAELKGLFESFTSISHAYVVKDPDSELNLGYGYVVFKSETDVEEFIKQQVNIVFKGKRVLFTSSCNLPPKKGKVEGDTPSFQEASNSRPSQVLDSDFSECNDPQKSHQGSFSLFSKSNSNFKSREPDLTVFPHHISSRRGEKASIVSDWAEAGDSYYIQNSRSGKCHGSPIVVNNGFQTQLLSPHFAKELSSSAGIVQNPGVDKDNTGYTQTTRISSNQGWTQLQSKFKLNARRAKLADVLRACPYLNNSPENYKFNTVKGRRRARPAQTTAHIY